MDKKKTIAQNSIIYTIKTMVGLLVPIVTFPYVSRVLSVDAIGKVNFSASIISYFSLVAALGIYTVAVRGGAALREDRNKISEYASDVFSYNVLTTIAAYLLFVIMLLINKKWHDYTVIMLIISTTIPLTTLGVEWVCIIYEDYFFITVRTIFVQIVSIFFLLIFVRKEEDVYYYAMYTVLVSVGSNIFNFFRAKKYVDIHFVVSERLQRLIKPTLVIFSITVANQIYINSDITILGYLTSDAQVGLYNAAVKLYNIVKSVMLSIGTVSMPYLAYHIGKKEYDLYSLRFVKLCKMIIWIALPAAFGLFVVGKDAMLLYAGSKYEASGAFLRILAFSIPFSVVGHFFASSCLVLLGEENKIMIATITGAVLNIVLNLLFIPKYGTIVAAFTTLLSETVSTAINAFNIGKLKCVSISAVDFIDWKTMVASALMFLTIAKVSSFIDHIVIRIAATVATGIVSYFAINTIFRNTIIKDFFTMIKKERQ